MRSFLVLLLSAVLVLGHALPMAGSVAASETLSGKSVSMSGQGMEQGVSAGHLATDRAAPMGCCPAADLADDTAAGHCTANCVFILPLSVLSFPRQPVREMSLSVRGGTAFTPPLALRPPIA